MTMTLVQALAALEAAGKIKKTWIPGMLGTVGRVCDEDRVLVPRKQVGSHQPFVVPVSACVMDVVTQDMATAGCLLAQYREAVNLAYVQPEFSLQKGYPVWTLGHTASCESEVSCIAAGLIAFAEALPTFDTARETP